MSELTVPRPHRGLLAVARGVLSAWMIFASTLNTSDAASPNSLPPAHPCDIIIIASRFTIPQIDLKEPTTLKEALTFIYSKYRDVDIDPPRPTTFVFEYRLPEATLQRHVSFQAKDVTMIGAIKLALGDVPVVLTFEPGKIIFSSPSPQADAPASPFKP